MSNTVIPKTNIVQVDITISEEITTGRNFSLPLFVTKENTPDIDQLERVRQYGSLEEVAEDWDTTDESYKMAQAFFSQNPRPEACLIGVRFEEDLAGFLDLGPIGDIVGFQAVTDGSFKVSIDGGLEQDIIDIDFTHTAGYLTCEPSGDILDFQVVTDGSFKVTVDGGTEQEVTGLNFEATSGYLTCGTSGLLADFQTINIFDKGSFAVTIDDGTPQNVTGLVFFPEPAALFCGPAGAISAFQAISDGSFRLPVNGTILDIYNLDFSAVGTYQDIVNVIQAKMPVGPPYQVNVSFNIGPFYDSFEFRTDIHNYTQTMDFLQDGVVGTSVAGTNLLNGKSGQPQTVQQGSGASSFDDVAGIITNKMGGTAVCTYDTDHFVFTSSSKGLLSTVSVLSGIVPQPPGEDISGSQYLNGQTGTPSQGSGPSNFQDIADIVNLSSLSGAVCSFEVDHFVFTSSTFGDLSSVSVLADGTVGTSVAGSQYLNGIAGTPSQGGTIDTYEEIAEVISNRISGAACLYYTQPYPHLRIISDNQGDSSSVSILGPGSGGTPIEGSQYMNGADEDVVRVVPGHTYVSITDELSKILEVNDSAFFLAFTKEIRDSQDVKDIAAYVLALSKPYQYFTASNNILLLDSSITTDIASELKALENRISWVQYSSYPSQYPEVSALGRASTVSFDGQDTLITMKFKTLPGINPELKNSPSTFNTAKLGVVTSKYANVYSQIGNTNMLASEGQMSSGNYQDEMHFAAWLADALETAVFNVIVNANKIPYTEAGISLLESAMNQVFEQGIRNGGLAPQIGEDGTFFPAYRIFRVPVRDIDPTKKAQRIYDGFSFIAYLAGAIHFVKPIEGKLTATGLAT